MEGPLFDSYFSTTMGRNGDESGLKGPELSPLPTLFGSFGSFGKKWVLIINELGSIFSTTMSIFNDNSVNSRPVEVSVQGPRTGLQIPPESYLIMRVSFY